MALSKSINTDERHINTDELPFNTGKLYHVSGYEIDENGCLVYTNECKSEAATRALLHDPKLLKVDGECSALHSERGPDEKSRWVFYARRDNYRGTWMCVPLPSGVQPALYDQGGKAHSYCLARMPFDHATGRGQKKDFVAATIYMIIARAVADGNLPDPNAHPGEWITCELVGRKHQNNVDGIPFDHALIPHRLPFTPQVYVKSFEDFEALARHECFEGIVLLDPETSERFKLRCDAIPGSLWNQRHGKKPSEPCVTTIHPQVLTVDGIWSRSASDAAAPASDAAAAATT